MLFDDAWCICTQGGENTSQFHTFQYRLIHLHTLKEICLRLLRVGGSHARLKGAVNDAWNMYTLLRLGLK